MESAFDLVVVGEGVAGLTCAGEAAALGLRVASIESEFQGGLVMNIVELEGYEAAGGLSGMDHAMSLAASNRKAGVRSVSAPATAVRPVAGGFEVDTGAGRFAGRAVVLATGARLRKLGVPGEEDFRGRGVSHCADCDAPMFTAADVVVAGGGDSAFQEALVLAGECAVVHIVFDGAQPTAHARFRQAAAGHAAIRLWPGRRVAEVLGDSSGMTGVRLAGTEGGPGEVLPCAGLFTYIGLEPNASIAPPDVRRDAGGALVTDGEFRTALPFLWAIGQVRAGFGGRLHDAEAEGRSVARRIREAIAASTG